MPHGYMINMQFTYNMLIFMYLFTRFEICDESPSNLE